MTENKYFVTHSGGTVHCDSISRELEDGSFEELSYQDIVDKLNENEQLKKENKILSGLYDLDTLSDKFYVDGHWLKNKHSMGIIANMFDYHEAHLVCGILNDLLPYKLLVRKHKQDLESIYGKSIKEQLEELI